MTVLPAIESYLAYQGVKYMAPDKAGAEKETMLALKKKGQAARKEFVTLAKLVQEYYPKLELERASNWMNQAQILRPHFWNYLRGFGQISEPMFALRLYGEPSDFGVSVEVSFIERKKDDFSLDKQNRVLDLAIAEPLYYVAQIDGESRPLAGTEENRRLLKEQVETGQARKVLVKYNVSLQEVDSLEDLAARLAAGIERLIPYYEATRSF